MGELVRKKLFELEAEAMRIAAALIEKGGEIDEHTEKEMHDLTVAIDDKADAYFVVTKTLEAVADQLKIRSSEYSKKSTAVTAEVKRLRDRMKAFMINQGIKRVGNESEWSVYPHGERWEIDMTALEPRFKKAATEWVADRDEITAAIARGETVKGVVITPSYSIKAAVAARKVRDV